MNHLTRHRLSCALAALAIAGVCVGCRDAATGPGDRTGSSADTGTVGVPEIALERVAQGLEQPLFVTHGGDGSGRLFVVEQTGRVRVIRDGTLQSGAFIDLSKLISTGGERGLLGLAFAPDYGSTGRFYVNFTDRDGDTVVARMTADAPQADRVTDQRTTTVLRVKQPYANHNGGCIVFGPDEELWVGMGDGGSGGDPEGNAQNPSALLGKMLSLRVSDAEGRPDDDPAVRTRLLGVRNPWRFSFDPENGDLWIGDVGQNKWEEIDHLTAQSLESSAPPNLGWNLWEGTHPYEGGGGSRDGFVFPVTEYGRDVGQSVTGGYVYRGASIPGLSGTYVYADYSAGWIAGLTAGATPAVPFTLVSGVGNPSSLGEDEAGELYVCDYGGSVSRLVAK